MLYKMKIMLNKHCPTIYQFLRAGYHKFVKKALPIKKQEEIQTALQVPTIVSKNSIVGNIIGGVKRKHRILIIGRRKEGDSIGTHTEAFLSAVDFGAYDVFFYDEYTHSLALYSSKTEIQFVKTCVPPELDSGFFDMFLYLNVLDNGTKEYPFADRVLPKPAFLSFAYPVFDGTEPPRSWVNYLNGYFDGVLVPCRNLKNIYERAGVTKPIFELPILLDLRRYSQTSVLPHKQTPYVFGWIGTFENRKNPIKIIQAFENVFGNRVDVQLRMHTRYVDHNTSTGKQFKRMTNNLPANVIVSEGVKSDQEIVELMQSFDVYVYVSQGEGYSITPRQALACGLPLVISAIPTHRDITTLKEEDGIFWVRAETEIAAVQPSLNHQICGKMYDIEVADLEKALAASYEKRELIYAPEKIKARQKAAFVYDHVSQMFNYRQIILPNQVRLGEQNQIREDGLETTNQDLALKYHYYLEEQARPITICPAHDGGFCSLFNKWLSHLVYLPEDTILIPDWRVQKLKTAVYKEFGRETFTSFCYGQESDGNIFFRCFENPYHGLLPESCFEGSIMYDLADNVLDMGDFNAAKEPNLTYINSYKLYADKEYFPIFRNIYHRYYKKYVKLIPELQEKIDQFYEENFQGKLVITAQIRSEAHWSELLDGDKPTWDLYEKHIRRILRERRVQTESDEWRLFIASDNNQSIEHFRHLFGNHVLAQTMKRLTEQDENEYQAAAKKAGKNIEGFGIQHRIARAEDKWSLNNAYEILFDVHMLAKGEYFIFVNSNISTMVSYLNPEIEMVYCL